jgi:hypothetical protein
MEQPFLPFDVALEEFYRVGGARVTAILSPRPLLQRFLQTWAEGTGVPRYADAPIQLAEQGHVSVRGRTVTGQELEVPVPTGALRAISHT